MCGHAYAGRNMKYVEWRRQKRIDGLQWTKPNKMVTGYFILDNEKSRRKLKYQRRNDSLTPSFGKDKVKVYKPSATNVWKKILVLASFLGLEFARAPLEKFFFTLVKKMDHTISNVFHIFWWITRIPAF